MDVDRAQAGERHADRDARHRVFRERRAEDALRPELLHQPARGALDRLRVVDVEAEADDARIALHLLERGVAQRVDVVLLALAHDDSLKTCVCSASGAGNGEFSANAKASAISASTSVSIRLRSSGSTRRRHARHLVVADPRLGLAAIAVAEVPVLAGADVFLPAVGHALEEERARVAAAHRFDHRLRAFRDPQHVAVLDALRRQAERRCARADVGHVLADALVGVDRVAVVLAEEEHGQLLQRGEVQALVEDALVDRAVAEHREHHARLAAQFHRDRIADRVRDRRADHRRGAEDTRRDVDHVHRAALAACAAGRLAVELREHRAQIAALGEIERVRAIRTEDGVVAAQRFADADRHRLLPDRKVHRRLDHVGRIDARDLLFDAADPVERAVDARGISHAPPPSSRNQR